jgi:hypothetical protein
VVLLTASGEQIDVVYSHDFDKGVLPGTVYSEPISLERVFSWSYAKVLDYARHLGVAGTEGMDFYRLRNPGMDPDTLKKNIISHRGSFRSPASQDDKYFAETAATSRRIRRITKPKQIPRMPSRQCGACARLLHGQPLTRFSWATQRGRHCVKPRESRRAARGSYCRSSSA